MASFSPSATPPRKCASPLCLIRQHSHPAQFSLYRYPDLAKVWPCVQYGDNEEIYDVDFNDAGDLVMGTSARKLQIFSTKSADDSPAPLQTIERPSMTKDLQCTFRAGKCVAIVSPPCGTVA